MVKSSCTLLFSLNCSSADVDGPVPLDVAVESHKFIMSHTCGSWFRRWFIYCPVCTNSLMQTFSSYKVDPFTIPVGLNRNRGIILTFVHGFGCYNIGIL